MRIQPSAVGVAGVSGRAPDAGSRASVATPGLVPFEHHARQRYSSGCAWTPTGVDPAATTCATDRTHPAGTGPNFAVVEPAAGFDGQFRQVGVNAPAQRVTACAPRAAVAAVHLVRLQPVT